MTQPTSILNPNETIRVKHDTGEYYADFPSQVILVASQGSVGRIVSLDEFKTDFIRRLGKQDLSKEQQQAYRSHFSVVGKAMARGLQYPVRFEKVVQSSGPVDFLRARPGAIELVDAQAIEKASSGMLEQVTGFLKMAIGYSESNQPSEIDMVYLHHTSILAHHNFWHRLKQVVDEAAYDIIDSLHFPKSNHEGYSWEEIADMLEKNDPRKPLWYTLEQQEALVVAAQNIYQTERERGFDAMTNDVDPDLRQQSQDDSELSQDQYFDSF